MAFVSVSDSSPALAEHTRNLAPVKTWAEMDAAGIRREDYQTVQRDGAMVARESHNLEVASSTPAPAPNFERGGTSFSPAQAAARIGITAPSIYRWIRSGRIPAESVDRAPNGTMQIAESGIANISRKCSGRPLAPSLSMREIEVLKFIADGKTYKEIGLIAGLSSKTVDCYAQRIKLKTRVNSLALLIRYAIKEGHINA